MPHLTALKMRPLAETSADCLLVCTSARILLDELSSVAPAATAMARWRNSRRLTSDDRSRIEGTHDRKRREQKAGPPNCHRCRDRMQAVSRSWIRKNPRRLVRCRTLASSATRLLGSASLKCAGRAIKNIANPLWHDDAKVIHRLTTVVAGMDHVAAFVCREAFIKRIANLLFAQQTRVRDKWKPFLFAASRRDWRW